ncbi:MAG: signal transduction histidine kinase [Woeseiaceae bacterium]|jgi:signal transduction histidine kinase
MNPFSRLVPKSIEGQLFAVVAIIILLMLSFLITIDLVDRRSPLEWAGSNVTLNRLTQMRTVLENVNADRRQAVLRSLSGCHNGYTLTAQQYDPIEVDSETNVVRDDIARRLAIGRNDIVVGRAELNRDDFSYAECNESEVELPMTAMVISVLLPSGEWFNTEVHPHEWHLQDLLTRIVRYALALILVGIFALFLIRKLSKPLNQLTDAANRFADGLQVSPVNVFGPPDLKKTIQSFNAMQQQVADDVRKRTNTLAAISHDLRTPLTALRIRAELVEDEETRADLVASIDKMDKVIASALEYLRGESRSEPFRKIDLSALLASECSDFEETGQNASFVGEPSVYCSCRPDALARAVRNLIENANKYADGATVGLHVGNDYIDISVSDTGPGIAEDQVHEAVKPFRRLSSARESQQGGFGLGLAIVEAIVNGHDGVLTLTSNRPTGLIVTIRLPVPADA